MPKKAIILFTRLPIAGMVKTRLMPHLSGEVCADLQWALLADLATVQHNAETDLFVFYTPSGSEQTLQRLEELFATASCLPQQGDNLGQRMHQAFVHIFQQSYKGCICIGSDIPLISNEDIKEAWQVLSRNDAIFGPSEDGGYWLVGLKEPFWPLFQQNYSHQDVLAEAQRTCMLHRLSVGLTATKRDIDIWADLQYFKQTVKQEQALHLHRFMQGI